jgi:hypothetical protein
MFRTLEVSRMYTTIVIIQSGRKPSIVINIIVALFTLMIESEHAAYSVTKDMAKYIMGRGPSRRASRHCP